jgi:hypothetical protein
MQFMILRRSDAVSEAAGFPSAELVHAVPSAQWLHPSASGLRMTRSAGEWRVSGAGPFDARELVAGYTFVEAASREEAALLASRWPLADAEGNAELEVRQAGCPGGCVGFDMGTLPQGAPADLQPAALKPGCKPYAVLLRSDAGSEADLEPPAAVIDTMNRANQAGIALAGEGLRASSKGARVKFSGGKASIIDGPYAEVKELIAGYWLVQAESIEGAMEWVRNYPYPHPPDMDVVVELRGVHLGA